MAYKFALVGNPNCGKTTLFNALTGSNQYVGNWPGVTVEKKEGKITESKDGSTVVDLPGIYSLSPYSMEEIVARNFIIDEKPDLIINIVDATNLERNLYLTLQIVELAVPMVIALNMIDIVEKRGDKIDYSLLSTLLGITIVPISASKNIGIHKLLNTANHEILHARTPENHPDRHFNSGKIPEIYSHKIKDSIDKIEMIIETNSKKAKMPLRWSAVKLIEGDKLTVEKLSLSHLQTDCIDEIVKSLESKSLDREMVIADQKYKYICTIREKVLRKKFEDLNISVSDRIDKVVTNKFLAIPFFIGIMALIFYLTFGSVGSKLTELINYLMNDIIAVHLRNLLDTWGASDWAVALVCNGIFRGVGTVLTYFPQILILFFFLSILEDSGYMSRAAFIMDRALHTIGLSGKSFVPMLMGFGCSVPALMATRTLQSEKDKRLTAMMIPFMSCGAKMPVYSLFIMAFFPASKWLIVCSLYFLGVFIAIIVALILQATVLKGAHSPFVMELPPYRLPTTKTLSLHLWEKIKDFLTKAGTVLLGASVVIWFLQYFDFSLHHVDSGTHSILGIIGKTIAPIFAPLGFGNWESSVAVLSGLVARESIVSTLSILIGTAGLSSFFTSASAYSFMVFCLLFIPCIAAITALHREMGSLKWTVSALGFQTAVAWIVTFIIYNIAKLVIS